MARGCSGAGWQGGGAVIVALLAQRLFEFEFEFMVSLARPRDWWPPIMRGNVYDSVIWSLFYLIYESESERLAAPLPRLLSKSLPLPPPPTVGQSAAQRPQRLHVVLMIMDNYDGSDATLDVESKAKDLAGIGLAIARSNGMGKLCEETVQKIRQDFLERFVSLDSCKCKLFISFNYWQRFSKSK